MNYPEYKADLQRIHESEFYGLIVFQTAAFFTINEERKKKWLKLKHLEEMTLNKYLTYMKENNKQITEPNFIWTIKGYLEGFGLSILPWKISMKLLKDATIPFQEKFLRLKNNCDPKDLEFFTYVYKHEKSLEAFAIKELSNEKNSLSDVEVLLK